MAKVETPYVVGYNKEEISRYFIETPFFTKRWNDLGFNDEDLLKLQIELIEKPKSGRIVSGTGGLRKMRYAFKIEAKAEAFVFVISISKHIPCFI